MQILNRNSQWIIRCKSDHQTETLFDVLELTYNAFTNGLNFVFLTHENTVFVDIVFYCIFFFIL